MLAEESHLPQGLDSFSTTYYLYPMAGQWKDVEFCLLSYLEMKLKRIPVFLFLQGHLDSFLYPLPLLHLPPDSFHMKCRIPSQI